MDVKVVLLNKAKLPCTLGEIEGGLKTAFPNIDYAKGFLDGYLFDYYKLLTLEEYERKTNTYLINNEDYYIKFIYIDKEED